jgi:tetratricopeptide (TPR) repeat protein/tRNA A-37 threonylcarbamoyl transferase component Bud32
MPPPDSLGPGTTLALAAAGTPVEELWRRWRRDPCQGIGVGGDLTADQALTVLRYDQLRRWHGGDRVPAEHYLESYPVLTADTDRGLVFVFGEFLLRRELGEAPALDEYVRRFPKFADRLRQQDEFHRALVGASYPTLLEPLAAAPAETSPPSDRVGDCRIVGELARGGMGVVHQGHDEPLDRDLAVKVLRDEHVGRPEFVQRFLAEARICGQLQHPGVVPIHQVGRMADGRPYFTMKLVRGRTLAALLADRLDPLADLSRFLRVFEQVCQTIAFAHSRCVIHRDLKPANIMVGAFGEVQVMDWGLAKMLKSGSIEPDDDCPDLEHSAVCAHPAAISQPGAVVGTPAYMAPEQARGEAVDERSDVYGLGATLYELLTGRVAFPTGHLDAVRQGLFTPPRRVNPTVPRALEAVCLKAMAPRPENRYASVLGLATDVEHWLTDEPLSAWPDSPGARLRRWSRRHARLVAGVLAALVVSVVCLGIATALLTLANDRERAARARTRAALDAMTSEVTGDALTRQKEIAPEQRAFLEGVLGYYEEFAEEPGEGRAGRERLAAAHYRLGMIRARLGPAEAGAEAFRLAAAMYERLAAEFPTEAIYRKQLARSHNNQGTLLRTLGRHAAAEAAHSSAVAVQNELVAAFPAVPAYRQELAHSHNNLGNLYLELNRTAEAEAEYRAAVAVHAALAADFPSAATYRENLAGSQNNLGVLLRKLGNPAEAEAAYRAAVSVLEKLAAEFPQVPRHRQDLGGSHTNLGRLLADAGRRADAEAEFRAAVAVHAALAADFPAATANRENLGGSQNNLGVLLSDAGRFVEAEAAHRAALALREKLVTDFPTVPAYRQNLAYSHSNLAVLLRKLGRPAEAEAAHRAALALRETMAADFPGVPEYRQEVAGSYNNLGVLLRDSGRHAEATSAHRTALALEQKMADEFAAVPGYRQDVAVSHFNLGLLLIDAGQRTAAAAAFRSALDVREKLVADFPAALEYQLGLAGGYADFGIFLRQGGEPEASLDWYAKAIRVLEPLARRDSGLVTARQRLRACHSDRALALSQIHNYSAALVEWEEAMKWDDGSGRLELALGRADTLARAGDTRRTMEAADALAAAPGLTPAQVYDLACVYALAAGGAAALSPADAERAAARAVVTLRRAAAAGFADTAHLLADPDLSTLRRRDDYAELLWDLADWQSNRPSVVD